MKVLALALTWALVCGAATPGAVVDDVASLRVQLRSGDAYERGKAIDGLIRDASPDAWELILDSLEDPAGRVADKAQWALAQIPQPLREELLGKRGLRSRKPLVVLRVAELLGRMESALQSEVYIRALRHKDSAVRRSLLWSVERQAQRGQLEENSAKLTATLIKLANKDREPAVRAQALVTLGALAPEAARTLIDPLSQSKDQELRAAATELIPMLSTDRVLPALQAALADEARVVRLRASEAAAALDSLQGLQLLVGALEMESETRLTWQIVDLLRAKSGMQYGRDPRPWRRWVAQQTQNWSPVKEPGRKASAPEGTSSLVGMPILSTRIAFLIDFSGSMWEVRDGKTRKQRVDVQVREALVHFEDDVSFNLYPFAASTLPWKKRLTTASKRNIQDAIEYFEDCSARGVGDYWPAMLEAMQDPKVDTLMLLGDGAPSGGTRWDLRLMGDLFTHENRFRGVAVDVLLVETKGRLVTYWESLARRSGGRCLTVEL